jgi:heterotetrameric sarcosine oxidase gamma subunit
MPPTPPNRPVRRSAIETSHAALGARWIDAASKWPADYGDPVREAEVVHLSAGLAEVGDIAKFAVRGPGSTAALRNAGVELRPGEITAGGGGANAGQAWGLAIDEAYLLSPESSRSRFRLEGPAVSVVDVSSGLAMLRLAGMHAGRILAELCAVDLDPRVFLDRRIAQAPMANVRVTLARVDQAGIHCYDILVARDYAEYLWDALMHTGKGHGLCAVGPAAIEHGVEQ